MWRDLGVEVVGLISPKLEPIDWDLDVIRGAGVRVSSIGAEMQGLEKALQCAASVGAESVWMCPGPLGSLTWEQAADDFCVRIAPNIVRERARHRIGG